MPVNSFLVLHSLDNEYYCPRSTLTSYSPSRTFFSSTPYITLPFAFSLYPVLSPLTTPMFFARAKALIAIFSADEDTPVECKSFHQIASRRIPFRLIDSMVRLISRNRESREAAADLRQCSHCVIARSTTISHSRRSFLAYRLSHFAQCATLVVFSFSLSLSPDLNYSPRRVSTSRQNSTDGNNSASR